MRVVYYGRRSSRQHVPEPHGEGDVIELFSNSWDDFGHRTLFDTSVRIDGQEVELGPIKILVEEVHGTASFLDALRARGWSGDFPIAGANYVSVPAEIEFYEQLEGRIGLARTVAVAEAPASSE